jgi:hypothetical protein
MNNKKTVFKILNHHVGKYTLYLSKYENDNINVKRLYFDFNSLTPVININNLVPGEYSLYIEDQDFYFDSDMDKEELYFTFISTEECDDDITLDTINFKVIETDLEILGFEKDCDPFPTLKELTKAYRKLVLLLHPDKNFR